MRLLRRQIRSEDAHVLLYVTDAHVYRWLDTYDGKPDELEAQPRTRLARSANRERARQTQDLLGHDTALGLIAPYDEIPLHAGGACGPGHGRSGRRCR